MSKIKNSRLDQYGAEPFKQQQFGTAGVEGVNANIEPRSCLDRKVNKHDDVLLLIKSKSIEHENCVVINCYCHVV